MPDKENDELKMGESHVEWICRNCDGDPMFTHKEFIHHIKSIHSIDPAIAGSRKMLVHLDEEEYARSTYEWTFSDLKFTQLIVHRRAADDMMRWA